MRATARQCCRFAGEALDVHTQVPDVGGGRSGVPGCGRNRRQRHAGRQPQRRRQQLNFGPFAGGAPFSAPVGATLGGVTPGNRAVTSISFDLRGAIGALFADPAILTGGIEFSDLGYRVGNMRFDDLDTPGVVESGLAVLFLSDFALALAGLAANVRPRRERPAVFADGAA